MAVPNFKAAPARPAQRVPQAAPPSFTIETRSGARWNVGSGTPAFTVLVADRAAWERLAHAHLYEVAQRFVAGGFDVAGDLVAAARWWYSRRSSRPSVLVAAALSALRLETWFQTRSRARHNIEFHYDRSNAFYEQFLDRRMEYSAAYFTSPRMSLDSAQLAKLDHVVRKLDVRPGERFLDVGCGWGGLVIHAVERCGAMAVGATLSARQFEYASDAVQRAGLVGRARIELCDYRTLQGRFDKIASVGMYEHVGRHRLREYFETLTRLLTPDGLLLNSGIARPETATDDEGTLFLRRHVFPGGEVPCLADVIRAAEAAGLELLDVESLRHHYALTCAKWIERLQAHRDACLALVDAQTYRTWLLYLAGSAVSFESGESELYHTLFARRHDGPPHAMTRRYMYA